MLRKRVLDKLLASKLTSNGTEYCLGRSLYNCVFTINLLCLLNDSHRMIIFRQLHFAPLSRPHLGDIDEHLLAHVISSWIKMILYKSRSYIVQNSKCKRNVREAA